MIREKRLSPRRAKSRLPLSPRANSRLRLKPLLFRSKGGTPRERDSLASAPITNTHSLMLAPKAFGARSAYGRCRLGPSARPASKSTVCGLNGLRPSAEADGSLHLSPRPVSASSRLLLARLFAPCSNGNSRSRFGKKNCASLTFSLQNGIQKIPGEKGRTKANDPIPRTRDDGHLTKQLTLLRILL